MTLALLFIAQHVSDVNTSIFRSLRLLVALIYLSSGKCYTYIMCRVWLWVSVFLQACGFLWFLNILYVCGMFWCFMHLYWWLYAWAVHTWLEACWCYVAGLSVGDVVSECRLNHYWPVHCEPWGFRGLWPLVQEPQDTTRLQEHTHSEPHTTHNIGITLTTR